MLSSTLPLKRLICPLPSDTTKHPLDRNAILGVLADLNNSKWDETWWRPCLGVKEGICKKWLGKS